MADYSSSGARRCKSCSAVNERSLCEACLCESLVRACKTGICFPSSSEGSALRARRNAGEGLGAIPIPILGGPSSGSKLKRPSFNAIREVIAQQQPSPAEGSISPEKENKPGASNRPPGNQGAASDANERFRGGAPMVVKKKKVRFDLPPPESARRPRSPPVLEASLWERRLLESIKKK